MDVPCACRTYDGEPQGGGLGRSLEGEGEEGGIKRGEAARRGEERQLGGGGEAARRGEERQLGGGGEAARRGRRGS